MHGRSPPLEVALVSSYLIYRLFERFILIGEGIVDWSGWHGDCRGKAQCQRWKSTTMFNSLLHRHAASSPLYFFFYPMDPTIFLMKRNCNIFSLSLLTDDVIMEELKNEDGYCRKMSKNSECRLVFVQYNDIR